MNTVFLLWSLGCLATTGYIVYNIANREPGVVLVFLLMVVFWPVLVLLRGLGALAAFLNRRRSQRSPKPPCVDCVFNGVTCTHEKKS